MVLPSVGPVEITNSLNPLVLPDLELGFHKLDWQWHFSCARDSYVLVLDIPLDIALDIYKDIVIDIALDIYKDIVIGIAYDAAHNNAQCNIFVRYRKRYRMRYRIRYNMRYPSTIFVTSVTS